MVPRPKILFRGTHEDAREGKPGDDPQLLPTALKIADLLGAAIIRGGFDLILTGTRNLETSVGEAAVKACRDLGNDPRERIRTYLEPIRKGEAPKDLAGKDGVPRGFGSTFRPRGVSRRSLRRLCIAEAAAVVGLTGGSGTMDCLDTAWIARKLVFPIASAGGAASQEWDVLKTRGHFNRRAGDLDFLADVSLDPERLVKRIVDQCAEYLDGETPHLPRRIFIIHGRDGELKNEVARFLTQLRFEPVILAEQPDAGQTITEKLLSEVKDVGFAFVLYTPDDVGALAAEAGSPRPRARQNVVFEHGLLIGTLGRKRVCAIVKDAGLEMFSDQVGVLFKVIPPGGTLKNIWLDLAEELKNAGHEVDARLILS